MYRFRLQYIQLYKVIARLPENWVEEQRRTENHQFKVENIIPKILIDGGRFELVENQIEGRNKYIMCDIEIFFYTDNELFTKNIHDPNKLYEIAQQYIKVINSYKYVELFQQFGWCFPWRYYTPSDYYHRELSGVIYDYKLTLIEPINLNKLKKIKGFSIITDKDGKCQLIFKENVYDIKIENDNVIEIYTDVGYDCWPRSDEPEYIKNVNVISDMIYDEFYVCSKVTMI